VNFEIPDYWGIGKSVSRGFGTVKRQTTDDRRTGKQKIANGRAEDER